MHFKHFASLSLAAAFASTLLMSGCAVHARVYDPYYHDYHARDHETVYYNQWEHDSHREGDTLAKPRLIFGAESILDDQFSLASLPQPNPVTLRGCIDQHDAEAGTMIESAQHLIYLFPTAGN